MMSSTINRNVYALALINLLHWLDPEVFLISLCFYVEKYIEIFILTWDFPSGSVGKESSCPCRRCGLHLWAGKIPWGRRWWPTPVFLLGEFHGQRRLVDYSPWGHTESDTTEQLTHTHTSHRWLSGALTFLSEVFFLCLLCCFCNVV